MVSGINQFKVCKTGFDDITLVPGTFKGKVVNGKWLMKYGMTPNPRQMMIEIISTDDPETAEWDGRIVYIGGNSGVMVAEEKENDQYVVGRISDILAIVDREKVFGSDKAKS